MKKIGEIAQEQSLTAFEDLGNIANAQAKRTLTPSAGYGTGASTALTTNKPRPQADEVADILSLARQIKPWEISPDDQKAAKDALNVLEYCLIPATYDEAVYWIGRMLAHFPRRDIAGDGVVVADLAGSMVEGGASLIAIASVTESTWKAATKKNPWLPPSGEILIEVQDRTKYYQTAAHRIRNPIALAPPKAKEAPTSPWQGKAWTDMTPDVRTALWGFLEPLDVSIRQTYCRAIEVEYDIIESFFNQTAK